jgi:hypothetical protein
LCCQEVNAKWFHVVPCLLHFLIIPVRHSQPPKVTYSIPQNWTEYKIKWNKLNTNIYLRIRNVWLIQGLSNSAVSTAEVILGWTRWKNNNEHKDWFINMN